MIKLLIDFGANITFKDQMKQSIIFYIARDGKAKLMEFLIQYGLNVNESDLYG
jgi:ankyrin repeat protein